MGIELEDYRPIKRKLSKTSVISLPKMMTKMLDWKYGDTVDVYITKDQGMYIKKRRRITNENNN